MSTSGRSHRAVIPRLSAGEVRVRVGAVGISALGTQVAGVIDGVGPDTAGFAKNDRVAFTSGISSAVPTIVVSERDLIGIPADIDLDAAAAIFPCALLARTVVRQVHSVGRGNRVLLTDNSVIAPFIAAWVVHLGGSVSSSAAGTAGPEVVITGSSIRSALALRTGHGLAQQGAGDVFAAMRAGAFDGISLSSVKEAREGSRSPVLLHPAEVSLAA